MSNNHGGQVLKKFFERYGRIELFSTDAKVVHYVDPLYNVDGSTDDPDINGQNWKQLLISHGITGDCYVTDPLPDGRSSHPNFNVGGHMTPNETGSVPTGGTCYLMPLCNWHNSTYRNGIPFEHTSTKMLKLLGYMEGEPAVTFTARMSADLPFRLVSSDGDRLTTTLAAEEPQLPMSLSADRDDGLHSATPQYHILFRKVMRDSAERYVIESARLP